MDIEANYDPANCEDGVGIGEPCIGDGTCGTNSSAANCGNQAVYWHMDCLMSPMPPAAPLPPLSPFRCDEALATASATKAELEGASHISQVAPRAQRRWLENGSHERVRRGKFPGRGPEKKFCATPTT